MLISDWVADPSPSHGGVLVSAEGKPQRCRQPQPLLSHPATALPLAGQHAHPRQDKIN